jgi:hypothetical protein
MTVRYEERQHEEDVQAADRPQHRDDRHAT